MISRFYHAVKSRSVGEVLRLIGYYFVYPAIRRLTPQGRRARARWRAFDQKWGTDTSDFRSLDSLQVDPELARHAIQYEPSDSDQLIDLLDGLTISFSDYSFIDFGSGKGRIILTASLRPFRAVYGVEFSPELVFIAKQNLKTLRRRVANLAPVQVIYGNAATFEPPPGNLVCYFYNPFREQIMSEVVAKLEAALDTSACDIRIIYVTPVCRHLFEASGRWTFEVSEDGCIFVARSHA